MNYTKSELFTVYNKMRGALRTLDNEKAIERLNKALGILMSKDGLARLAEYNTVDGDCDCKDWQYRYAKLRKWNGACKHQMAAIMLVEGLEETLGDTEAANLIAVYEDNFMFEGPKGLVVIRPSDHVALQTLYFVRVTNVTDPDLKFVELIRALEPDL